jgi:hypothetical protein
MAIRRNANELEPMFSENDLRILKDQPLEHEIGIQREQWLRLVAARWVAIFILPAVALTALGVLAYYPENPPSWASPALFSILTAVVAFLFSDRGFDEPAERPRRKR